MTAESEAVLSTWRRAPVTEECAGETGEGRRHIFAFPMRDRFSLHAGEENLEDIILPESAGETWGIPAVTTLKLLCGFTTLGGTV